MAVVVLFVGLFTGVLFAGVAQGEDWPTYRHDNRRSGYTADSVDAATLAPTWTWRSPHPPVPAWPGPAKMDSYHGRLGMPNLRSYDLAFQPIAVGDHIYFGSSADDSVRCLDAKTGHVKWTFTTAGPVRIAPAFWQNKIYFGSDDGYAYCVQADDGQLVWKYRPVEPDDLVLNNGRFIPLWPCRTGVLVGGGTAHFSASLLPWKDSYLCAVDAETGRPEGKGRFVKQVQQTTMEAPMVASSRALIVPQGRAAAPQVFRRSDGKSIQGLHSFGGSVVVLTDRDRAFSGSAGGPLMGGNEVGTSDKAVWFGTASAVVVTGQQAYILTEKELMGVDLGPLATGEKKVLWKEACEHRLALVGAGDTLFAGGEDEVAAYRMKDGKQLWKHAVEGKALALAVAHEQLLVSTDAGLIYAFEAGAKQSATADEDKPDAAPAQQEEQRPSAKQVALEAGPWLQFTEPSVAVVRWQTRKPSPTILEYSLADARSRIEDPLPKTQHEVELTGLKRNRLYTYVVRTVIDGQPEVTAEAECDTFFNYAAKPQSTVAAAYPPSDETEFYRDVAQRALAQSNADAGICLVLGCGEGQLLYELAQQSRLRVIGVDTDAQKLATARQRLLDAELYGARVAVHHVDSLSRLPLTGHFANLVVVDPLGCDTLGAISAAEIYRVLRPGGGVALVGQKTSQPNDEAKRELTDWLAADSVPGQVLDAGRFLWARVERGKLPGAGVWSHQYGSPENSAFGGETLAGATRSEDLDVQWLGRPGPRYQADRENRKPSPLAIGGRLFMQGLKRIIALDSYNGTILWSLEMPELIRFNMPKDCSNWCADEKHLYVAVRDKCWQLDAANGALVKQIDVVPAPGKEWDFEWGYIASLDDAIVGSCSRLGSAWTVYWGSGAWYDAGSRVATWKICSDSVFAVDKETGQRRWMYSRGVILNSTITVGDGKVFFVETRNEKVLADQGRRLRLPELWLDQHLVALDARTGEKLWEQPIDIADGTGVFYVAHGDDKLVLVSSTQKNFHIHVFDAAGKGELWNTKVAWLREGHGYHMSRPAIVSGTLYVRPGVFDLATGKRLSYDMPSGGCGTYACSTHSIFYREGTVQMWDREGGRPTTWDRLRPDCWLSTIPADGMLLSPEGGGGCSCIGWMETSVGFMPRRDDPKFETGQVRFAGSHRVAIQPPLEGGTIHYTLDGSNPTRQSPSYSEPIRLTDTALVRARVFRPSGLPSFDREVQRRFHRIEGKHAPIYRINFQPADGSEAPGFLADYGKPFDVRPSGHAYGWNGRMQRMTHRLDKHAADERGLADPLRDTSIHFTPAGTWQLAVADGEYDVTLGLGDPSYTTKDLTVHVGSVEFCSGLELDQDHYKAITQHVSVDDGKLTIRSNAGRSGNDAHRRLNYVIVKKSKKKAGG